MSTSQPALDTGIVELLASKAAPGTLSQSGLERFQREALEALQKQYPDTGIATK